MSEPDGHEAHPYDVVRLVWERGRCGRRPGRRERKSPRLPSYDYSWPGTYFVTICVADRMPRFGEVVDQRVCLNDAGKMVLRHWQSLPDRFPHVDLDEYVLMPNHLHAILHVTATDTAPSASLSAVVGAFKSLTTRDYIKGVRTRGWPPFERHLWQQSFYDHIIRDGRDLERVREYIAANPSRWAEDREYRAWQDSLRRQSPPQQDEKGV